MSDIVDSATRSRMMSGIRGKNTKPEMLIRQALRRMGIGYRLHGKDLPGKPDLVFRGRGKVLFVHGCFWHGHDCSLFRIPGTRPQFWAEKIAANVTRDHAAERKLAEDGWLVGTVWECAMRGPGKLPFDDLMNRVGRWLEFGNDVLTIRGVINADKAGAATRSLT